MTISLTIKEYRQWLLIIPWIEGTVVYLGPEEAWVWCTSYCRLLGINHSSTVDYREYLKASENNHAVRFVKPNPLQLEVVCLVDSFSSFRDIQYSKRVTASRNIAHVFPHARTKRDEITDRLITCVPNADALKQWVAKGKREREQRKWCIGYCRHLGILVSFRRAAE